MIDAPTISTYMRPASARIIFLVLIYSRMICRPFAVLFIINKVIYHCASLSALWCVGEGLVVVSL